MRPCCSAVARKECCSDTRYSLGGPQRPRGKPKMRQSTTGCTIKCLSNVHDRKALVTEAGIWLQLEVRGRTVTVVCGVLEAWAENDYNTLNPVW